MNNNFHGGKSPLEMAQDRIKELEEDLNCFIEAEKIVAHSEYMKTHYGVCSHCGELTSVSDKLGCYICEFKKLEEENERLRKGLEFYANKENWMQVIDGKYNLGKIWVYADYENRFINNSITLENGKFARDIQKEIGNEL